MTAGFVQANLVLLPRDWAFDFLLFCHRNPKPCPLLDVTDPGDPEPKVAAPGADLRTDLPGYRVWEHGELVAEPADVRDHWRDDLVGFLIGCSFTFESALQSADIPVRHIEEGRNVPMFRTSTSCRPAGRFHGPLVVSMRPMLPADAEKAARICERFPRGPRRSRPHRRPRRTRHRGRVAPRLRRGGYGQARRGPRVLGVRRHPRKRRSPRRGPPFAITHKPGHMLVTDLTDASLEG